MIKQRTIANKSQYYQLYHKGLLGNKPLTWNSYKEICNSGWTEGVCIRGRGIGRSQVKYNIPLRDVPKTIEEFKKEKISESKLTFNQVMPDEYLRIQGEVCRGPGGLYLHYTTKQIPMNLALREESLNLGGSKQS